MIIFILPLCLLLAKSTMGESTYTFIGPPWTGGYQARVCITNTLDVVCGWTVALEFSPKISSLEIWDVASNFTHYDIDSTTVQYVVSEPFDPIVYNEIIPPNQDFCLQFVTTYSNADEIPVVNSMTGTFLYRCTSSNSVTTTSPTPSSTTAAGNPNGYDFSQILELSILFYEAQRSGPLPTSNRIPWRGDSALNDTGNSGEDLTGGWYDAGDNLKLTFPMSAAVTFLLMGLHEWKDAYVASGQIEYMYDSVKWPLDYFLKSWNPVTQKFYGQVGNMDLDHGTWGRAEDMTMERPAYAISPAKPGSDLAAGTAAALALGSIVFRTTDPTYADELLAAAIGLYDFAKYYRGIYTDVITDSLEAYPSTNYKDELCLAATWLYRATLKQQYIIDAEIFVDTGLSYALSWAEKYPAAFLELYKITNNVVYRNALTEFVDFYISGIQYTPCGLAFRSPWGSLRYNANVAMLALLAAEEGIKTDEYRNWALGQISYTLGENPLGISYVIGYGSYHPLNPHHANSDCLAPPSLCDWSTYFDVQTPNAHLLKGALVAGPGELDNYVDIRTDYIMNEVAVDYNSGFQSAIAGLLHLELTDQFPQSSLSGCPNKK